MAKSTMVLWLACLVLQVLETSADNYSILLTYDANVSSSTAQTRFNNWATACGYLRGNSFTFSYFPAINDGVSLKGFRNMSAMLEELNVVGVLGGANYYLSLLNQTPNKTCGTGTQLNASTLDISMTGMVEVGVAYINFLRSHQNTGDYDRITQSETTIIALPKYFTIHLITGQSSAAGGSQSVDHISGSITEFTTDSWYKLYKDLFSVDLAARDDAWKVRLLLRKLGAAEHERNPSQELTRNHFYGHVEDVFADFW
ncbi:unnamed protein product [Schistocephalus solidus]|uniref:Secreted protein n=1 Tax=Schistocephalus solidus TaxID=70667 RepID=A0A183TB69_SCHSO|nr:unnamed protein product [Schistocephalus solidus]